MYNPSRGGVRGGADQFSWESVKNDKHRENYLGHSLKAPVGRWQKGKDLSWYAKERKDATEKSDKSELASIKRAEEEAMLIALGHNIVRKTQTLSKEDIQEALKRNTTERDEKNVERVDGVGASSQRVALLSGARKESRQKSEGVAFEGYRQKNTDVIDKNERNNETSDDDRKRSKKKSKKHKKEKKLKKHKESHDSDSSNSSSKYRTKHKKRGFDTDSRKSSKVKSHKKSKNRHKDHSSDDSDSKYQSNQKRHKKQNDSVKRRRHDTSESD